MTRNDGSGNGPGGAASSWRPPTILVRAVSAVDDEAARALGARLVPDPPAERPEPGRLGKPVPMETPWRLLVDGPRRAIQRPDGVRLELDFTAGRTAARRRERGLVRQPLARALGVARLRRRLGRAPRVVDATGGLGRDAWFAATLGCPVLLLERSPVVHALLEAALARAASVPATAAVAARVTLRRADALAVLPGLDPALAEVVYLDPMYPPHRRRAAVSKGMQFLHALLGPSDTGAGLLGAALAVASRQVTVKRPAGAPPLAGDESFGGQRSTIESPGTRYDVYLRAAPATQASRKTPPSLSP